MLKRIKFPCRREFLTSQPSEGRIDPRRLLTICGQRARRVSALLIQAIDLATSAGNLVVQSPHVSPLCKYPKRSGKENRGDNE